MHNRIPLSRGLGSSSTAIVAGLMAANYLTGSTLTRQQLVDYATEIEGHPDNVAPALLGGFTVSYMAHGKAASLRFVPKKAAELYCRSTGRAAFYRKGKAGYTGNGKP